jgi:hypothetical protein
MTGPLPLALLERLALVLRRELDAHSCGMKTSGKTQAIQPGFPGAPASGQEPGDPRILLVARRRLVR